MPTKVTVVKMVH